MPTRSCVLTRLVRAAQISIVPIVLASCGEGASNRQENAEASNAAVDPTLATGSVVRDTPAPPPPPVVTPIQTQQGPEGTRVDLTRAAVTGDILTVQLSYTAPADKYFSDHFRAEEVSVIDDTTAQRYGILKDQTGAWLAAPLFVSHSIRTSAQKGETAIVWMKFPAPPATSRTVSINIPKVGPFDGVPVTRQ